MSRRANQYHMEQPYRKGNASYKGQSNRRSTDRHGDQNLTHERQTEHKNPGCDGEGIKDDTLFDSMTKDLVAEMDEGFMYVGKTVAELFRALCKAAAKLPDMDLQTDMLNLHNDDNGLTVSLIHQENSAEGIHNGNHPGGIQDYGIDGFDYDFGCCNEFDDCGDFDGGDDCEYSDEEEGLLYDGD